MLIAASAAGIIIVNTTLIFLYAAVKPAELVAQAHVNGAVKVVVSCVSFKAITFGIKVELVEFFERIVNIY